MASMKIPVAFSNDDIAKLLRDIYSPSSSIPYIKAVRIEVFRLADKIHSEKGGDLPSAFKQAMIQLSKTQPKETT